MLLDQGAQSNLVTPEYVNEHGLQVGPLHQLVDGNLHLTGVGNIVTNQILGYTVFEVQVPGVKTYKEEHIALVVPDDSDFAKHTPIILGTCTTSRILPHVKETEMEKLEAIWYDTKFNEMLQIRRASVELDLKRCSMQPPRVLSGQITAPKVSDESQNSNEDIHPLHVLRTMDTIDIPPFSSHLVMAELGKLPSSIGEKVKVLVEPLPSARTKLHPAVRVQPCYHEVQPGTKKLPVYIVNRTGKDMKILKGSKVAYASQVINLAEAKDLKQTHEPEGSTKPRQSHEERLKKVFELLDLKHLEDWPEAEKQKAKDLMAEYSDIFALHELELGETKGTTHKIHVTDETPFKERYRHIPKHQMDEVRTMIEEMLRIGVIKESQSPWCNAVVLARKKNGDLRLCIDFRRLNQRTVKDSYPLPRIKEALDNIKGANIFTSLDFKQGFWEVPMDEESKQKTAFTVGPLGFYEFNRMPFGLCNAPATFQRLMEACLGELVLETCLIYVDDIIVFAKDENEHLKRLRAVFERIREYGLKMRPHKCTFFSKDVDYLGHHVSAAGIRPDDRHIARVKEFQIPKTVTEVRQFLGFVNHYRRFIKGHSKIARPLQKYTAGENSKEKSAKVELDQEAIDAFEALRNACITAPVLAFADHTKPFVLETDASKEALGAVLSQVQPDGTTKPVAYGSRTTTAGEKNYHSTKLEFLALKWAVSDEFKDYLICQPFVVKTDNNPLTYIFTTPHLDAVGHRWVQQLAGFNFEIKYVRGRNNGAADALSRLPRKETKGGEEDVTLSYEETKALMNEALLSPAERAELRRPEIAELQGLLDKEADASRYLPRELDLPGPGTEGTSLRVHAARPMRIQAPEWKVEQFQDPALKAIKNWIVNKKNSPNPELYPKALLYNELKNLTDEFEAQTFVRQVNKLRLTQGLLYRECDSHLDKSLTPRFVVPKIYRKRAIEGCHRDAGHQGQARTLALLQDRFWWPGMTAQSREAVKNCRRCEQSSAPPDKAGMCPIIATYPFELVHVDVVGIEKQPDAIKTDIAKVLVVSDHYTRYTQAFLIPNEQAKTIASVLWAGFFSIFGAPARLISDQGKNFESKLIAELCELLGVEKVRTTAYHPQGNGQVERANQTLIKMLRKLSADDKREWYSHLPTLTHAYNCTRSAVTGYSPYYLMFGRRPRMSVDLFFPTVRDAPGEKNYKRYVNRLGMDLRDAFAVAENAIAKESSRQKRYYDTKVRGVVLEAGDIVQLSTDAAHERRKIRDRWSERLYTVVSVNEDVPVVEIQPFGGGTSQRVHRNRLRLLRQGTNLAPDEVQSAQTRVTDPDGPAVPIREMTVSLERGSNGSASTVGKPELGTTSAKSIGFQSLEGTPTREQDTFKLPAEALPDRTTGQASDGDTTGPGQIPVELNS